MSESLAVGAVFGVLLANQFVMRFGGWHNRTLYLILQALNAAMAVSIAFIGLPGFEQTPMFRGALVLVFIFRIVWNDHELRMVRSEETRVRLEAERELVVAKLEAEERDEEETKV